MKKIFLWFFRTVNRFQFISVFLDPSKYTKICFLIQNKIRGWGGFTVLLGLILWCRLLTINQSTAATKSLPLSNGVPHQRGPSYLCISGGPSDTHLPGTPSKRCLRKYQIVPDRRRSWSRCLQIRRTQNKEEGTSWGGDGRGWGGRLLRSLQRPPLLGHCHPPLESRPSKRETSSSQDTSEDTELTEALRGLMAYPRQDRQCRLKERINDLPQHEQGHQDPHRRRAESNQTVTGMRINFTWITSEDWSLSLVVMQEGQREL